MESCVDSSEEILKKELFVSNSNNTMVEIGKNYIRKNRYTNVGVAARSFKLSGIGFSSKESLTQSSVRDSLLESSKNVIMPYSKDEDKIVKRDIENIKELLSFRSNNYDDFEDILQEITKEIEHKGIKVDNIIYYNSNLEYKIINTTLDNIIEGKKNTCNIEMTLTNKGKKESVIIDLPKIDFCKEKILSNMQILKYKENSNLIYKDYYEYKLLFNSTIFGYICFVFTYLISGVCLLSNKEFYDFIKDKKIKDAIRIIENSTFNKRLNCKYDMEGNLRIPVEILGEGIIKNAITDKSSSKLLEHLNTASCFREDIKSYPSSVPTSIEIVSGNDSKIIESLNEITEDYFMVDEIVGGEAGINPHNGDINIICSGYIHNGYQRGEKIKIYIETNILEIFNNVTSVTKDKYYFSDCLILSPFVLVENIRYRRIK
ncbi:metallopeptidase TldD-related protein [Clostridium sporogenes]